MYFQLQRVCGHAHILRACYFSACMRVMYMGVGLVTHLSIVVSRAVCEQVLRQEFCVCFLCSFFCLSPTLSPVFSGVLSTVSCEVWVSPPNWHYKGKLSQLSLTISQPYSASSYAVCTHPSHCNTPLVIAV